MQKRIRKSGKPIHITDNIWFYVNKKGLEFVIYRPEKEVSERFLQFTVWWRSILK